MDWPAGERDGFVFTPVNTVVNAFHLRSPDADGRNSPAPLGAGRRGGRVPFAASARNAARLSSASCSMLGAGAYRDGEGTRSRVVARESVSRWPSVWCRRSTSAAVAAWLAQRGMACSVYAAQYLMEGLFEHGAARGGARADHRAQADRSWRHMARKRHHHHLGGVGPEIQTEPGLEPRMGSGACQPAAAFRARRPAARPRLAPHRDTADPRHARARGGHGAHAARADPDCMGRRRGIQAGAHRAAWDDGAGRTPRVLRVPRSVPQRCARPRQRVVSGWLLDEDVTGSAILEVR